MKNIRILSMALILAMLLPLAACGAGSSEAASSAPSVSAPAAAQEPSENEAGDAEAPVQLPESVEKEPAQPVIDSSGLYPVFDELTTISAFLNIAPWGSMYIGPDAEFENAYAILAAEEYTNVYLDVTWSDPDTYNEKVNLLVAANDLPNITRDLAGLYLSLIHI